MDQKQISVQSGQVLVDTSVIPFIRRQDVEFAATDLLPYKTANFFFDETDVTSYVQRPSELVLTTIDAFAKKQAFVNKTTGAYFDLVDYNASNTIYINENYLTLNVLGATISSTSYSEGDIVYQNGTGTAGQDSNTFLGKVVYWEYKAGQQSWLVVDVKNGVLNTESSTANTIFNVRTNGDADVVSVLGNTATSRHAAGQVVKSISDNEEYTISSYKNYSGQIVSNINNSVTQISLPANVTSGVTYTLRVVSGTGIGQTRTNLPLLGSNNHILDCSAIPLTTSLDSTSRYTLNSSVVDDYGKLSGIFNIPESSSVKFRTGERLFTITDANDYLDPDALMKASAKFVASGLLNTKQEVRLTPVVVEVSVAPAQPPVVPPAPTQDPPPAIIVPRQPVAFRPRRRRDPVAQTFFTPEPASAKQNYGIFVSSVDLFFKSKPVAGAPQLPVTVRLVTTVNGYPTQEILGSATVYPGDVNTTDGISTVPSVDSASTKTKFTFDNPVYLAPSTEYAIVVFSESPEYEVWISELGESIIGTDRRVSEQPYAGSFFRSQNASTWTPYQNQDLMFVINRAVFTNSTATMTFKVDAPVANVNLDELILHSTELSFPATSIRYEIKGTFASDSTLDSVYTQVTPNEYYKFGADLKNSSATNNRRRVILASNANSMIVQVQMSTTDNTISPMFNTERFALIGIENIINAGGITSNNITITDGGGQHFDSNVANITVTLSGGYQLSGGAAANVYVSVDDIDATGNIVSLSVDDPGSGYVEAPTLTIRDATSGVTTNATAVINGEDSSFGGNAKARYLTRKITLADGFDAGDLRVFLRAARPQGTDIVVYYKVLSSADSDYFYEKNWKRMELVKDRYSLGQEDMVELLYRPNLTSGKLSYVEGGVEYPLGGKFKHFAIKIVLLSKDTTVVPYVKNYRAIATPEG
jgi:hypothetical protein